MKEDCAITVTDDDVVALGRMHALALKWPSMAHCMWEKRGCAVDDEIVSLDHQIPGWTLFQGFGLCVQDLEQRYNKLRVEVQMAQDADEAVTLDEVVRRVMRKEKQAAAAFPGTRASKSASKPAPAIPGVCYSFLSVCMIACCLNDSMSVSGTVLVGKGLSMASYRCGCCQCNRADQSKLLVQGHLLLRNS